MEKKGLKRVWKKEVRKSRCYASPLKVDNLLYLFTDSRWLIVLDAESGKQVYEHKIEEMRGTSYPSLVLAGDLIFSASENGRVAFIKPGQEYQEVARSEVPGFKSTPIFVGDTLYLRTGEDIRAIQ